MGILDKLLGKKNKKEINEKSSDINKIEQSENTFNQSLKYSPLTPELNPDMLEYDIQKWINKFFTNPYSYSSFSAKAYSCLVSSDTPTVSVEDRNINRQNEIYLNQYIDSINTSIPSNYGRTTSCSPSGQKAFNFIFTEQGQYMKTDYRLYVNCEHKHTSRMVYEVLKQSNPQENLQLKYVSCEHPKERNEKIVIYTSNENELNNMYSRLEHVYRNNPELFAKNQNLPFMKNYLPGIGFANSPQQDFVDLNNNVNPNLAKSFNSYMSEILLESLFDTTNRICAVDPEVNANITEHGLDYNTYKHMDDKYHKSIMQNMVDKVLLLSEKNNLDIKRNHNQNLPRYNNKKEINYDNPNNDDINI